MKIKEGYSNRAAFQIHNTKPPMGFRFNSSLILVERYYKMRARLYYAFCFLKMVLPVKWPISIFQSGSMSCSVSVWVKETECDGLNEIVVGLSESIVVMKENRIKAIWHKLKFFIVFNVLNVTDNFFNQFISPGVI